MPKAAEEIVTLNGSHGEGGGALLRTALCMSALTQKPVVIHSVRGAMRKPGLSHEDFALLSALAISCNARLEGDDVGSRKLAFVPQQLPKAIKFDFDITRIGPGKSPGNTLVVAHSLAALLSRTGAYSSVHLFGETHNNNTLNFDAFELATCRAHLAQGIGIYPHLTSAGFGFANRGELVVEYEPSATNPIEWQSRGGTVRSGARVTAVELHSRLINDAATAALKKLQEAGLGDDLELIEISGPEPGLSVTFHTQFERGFASSSACLPKGGKPFETVHRAWEEFHAFLSTSATVDPFLADQLLLTAAFADGKTTYTTSVITRRLQTIAWVIKQFLPIAITIKGTEGSPGTITVQR